MITYKNKRRKNRTGNKLNHTEMKMTRGVMIRRLIAIVVAVVLGVSLISCEKDNPQPEVPVVIAPVEPEVEEEPKSELEPEKFLAPAFRLKVYYTKLNLIDTTYIQIVGLGNEKVVETKVVPEGDISVSNFREGKYDLVDSTDYYGYNTVFEFKRINSIERSYIWTPKYGTFTLFGGLYKEGYIHKVVVEVSNIDAIDYRPNRLDNITKTEFLKAFEEYTYNYFKDNFLKRLNITSYVGYPLYYIKDLLDEPVETDMYIEFKDVPYYMYYTQ